MPVSPFRRVVQEVATLEKRGWATPEGVKDVLVDDQAWAIRYLVANTGSWLTGQAVARTRAGFDKLHFGETEMVGVIEISDELICQEGTDAGVGQQQSKSGAHRLGIGQALWEVVFEHLDKQIQMHTMLA